MSKKRVPDYVKRSSNWRKKDRKQFTRLTAICERKLLNIILKKRPAAERKRRRGFKKEDR